MLEVFPPHEGNANQGQSLCHTVQKPLFPAVDVAFNPDQQPHKVNTQSSPAADSGLPAQALAVIFLEQGKHAVFSI